MKKLIFLLFIFIFTLNSYAANKKIIKKNNGFYNLTTYGPSIKPSSHDVLFYKWRKEINQSTLFPNSIIKDVARDNDDNPLYNVFYTVGDLGFRETPNNNNNLSQHIIVAGDSNTFGIGCNDNETFPYYLSKKFPQYKVFNMGMPGTGVNNTLRFLEVFQIKDILPDNHTHGVFLLDFKAFTIERIIGSKNFLKWGKTSPRYILNENNEPIYQGSFAGTWQDLFYKFLNKFPYSDILFPNLPRISEEHIELTARIIMAIKKRYFAQTSPYNKFIVILDPIKKLKSVNDDNYASIRNALKEKLIKYNVDFLEFSPDETLDLPSYKLEAHRTPEGHKNFAEMIYKKLKI